MNMKHKHEKYLSFLTKLASNSVPVANHRLAACVVYKGDIISASTNMRKTHPIMLKYRKNKEAVFLHAEIAAIKNALKIITVPELSKSTLYVARVRKDPNFKSTVKGARPDIWGNACPCEGCQKAIIEFEIGKVIYTTDDTEVFKEL